MALNPQNLIPVRSVEEARTKGARGGIKSGEARRRKRAMRDVLDDLLQMPLKKGEISDVTCLGDLVGANGKINLMGGKVNVTVEQAILLSQVVAAIGGNTKAATFLRDTAGQKILKDNDERSEYEDDGFTEAIKRSAGEVWK